MYTYISPAMEWKPNLFWLFLVILGFGVGFGGVLDIQVIILSYNVVSINTYI